MSESVKRKIADYLASHRYLALATVSPGGVPFVHTMGYVSDGSTVYCSTFRDRQKVRNISTNHSVAYVVNDHSDDFGSIRGVQMRGTATIVGDREEAGRVLALMMERFPPFAALYEQEDIVLIKVEAVEGLFIDFSREIDFGEGVTY